MRSPFRQSGAKPGGFTLLEMIIALAAFVLLAAAVFGIITGVLRSVLALHDNQNRRDQIAALNAFLGNKLRELPAQSSLTSYQRGKGEGLPQNGIIFGGDDQVIVFDAVVQPNGYYTLRVATATARNVLIKGGPLMVSIKQLISQDTANLEWRSLIRDVKSPLWKFQNNDFSQWTGEWSDLGTKPNMVEFSMQLAGDLKPVTMEFWVPHLFPVTLPVTLQTQVTPHAP